MEKIIRKLIFYILELLVLYAYKACFGIETNFYQYLSKYCLELLRDYIIDIYFKIIFKIPEPSYKIYKLYKLVFNPSDILDLTIGMILYNFLNNISLEFVNSLSIKFIYNSSLPFSLFWAVNSYVYVYDILSHLLYISKQ